MTKLDVKRTAILEKHNIDKAVGANLGGHL